MVDSSFQIPNPVETEQLLTQINEQLNQGKFNTQDGQLLQKMVESLGDQRGMIRLGFVEAFGEIGQPATPFLIDALAHHSNPVVRRSAGKGLAKIKDDSAIPTLINALLKDEDTVVRNSAAGALARMGAKAVPALLGVIEGDTPPAIKGLATWALEFLGIEAVDPLYAALNSDQAEVRTAVVGALANIATEHQDERFLTVLNAALQDQAIEVRLKAATALSQFSAEFALPYLLPLFDDPDLELTRTAILSVGKLGDRKALPDLKSKLADERVGIPQIAKIAISQIENNSTF